MLLRRITKHLTDQNWFAVFIDFLIVVVGVFIGIQVANWNESRADKIKEVEFYKHALENLQSDLDEYEITLKFSEWRMSAINQVNREITGEDLPHILVTPLNENQAITPTPYFDIKKSAPSAISLFATFEGHRSAFEALISSGDIGIVRNKKLLKDLQQYYVQIDAIDEMEKRLTVFRDQLHEHRSIAGIASTDQMTASELAVLVGDQPALLASMKGYWLFSDFHRRALNKERLAAETLITRVEQEIK